MIRPARVLHQDLVGYELYHPTFRDHIRQDCDRIIGDQNELARDEYCETVKEWASLPPGHPAQDYVLRFGTRHLLVAGRLKELNSLLDNEAFRRQKIAITHSVHILCEDIRLVFEKALDHDELADVVRFGFMHGNYTEGRFGKQDVLNLYREDPDAAIREARLYRNRPRFRFLLLLATYEAQAGRHHSSSRLVSEAIALQGVDLPAGDRDFLCELVVALLKEAIAEAINLLRAAYAPAEAANLAAIVAGGLTSDQRRSVLEAGIFWLHQADRFAVQITPVFTDSFRAIANEAVLLSDEHDRNALVHAMEELIGLVKTPLEQIEEKENYFGNAALISSLRLRASERKELIEVKLAMHSALAAALINSGQVARGLVVFENAWHSHTNLDYSSRSDEKADNFVRIRCEFPWSFAMLTRAARTVPEPHASVLLNRLIDRATGIDARGTLFILKGLSEDMTGSGLYPFINRITRQVHTLPWLVQLEFIHHQVRACARGTIRIKSADFLQPVEQIPLFGWNPFLCNDDKLDLVRVLLAPDAIAGKLETRAVEKWLKRMAVWVLRLRKDEEKETQLRYLLDMCSWIDWSHHTLTALTVSECLPDERLRAQALTEALQTKPGASISHKLNLRRKVVEVCETITDQRCRCEVWLSWLNDVAVTEEHLVQMIRKDVLETVRHPLRVECLGKLAGVLRRLGRNSESDAIWCSAATADQEDQTQPTAIAAWAVVMSCSANETAWMSLLDAVASPDHNFARRLVEAAASANTDRQRLAELEARVRQIPLSTSLGEPQLFMHLALARAWNRLGRPRQAAQLALEGFRLLQKSRPAKDGLMECEFRILLSTALELHCHPLGRKLLLRLILLAFPAYSHITEQWRVSYVADKLSVTPMVVWTSIILDLIYCNITFPLCPLSGWPRVDALASVARAFARSGQVTLAEQILRTMQFPHAKEDPIADVSSGAEVGHLLVGKPTCVAAALFRLAQACESLTSASPLSGANALTARGANAALLFLKGFKLGLPGNHTCDVSDRGSNKAVFTPSLMKDLALQIARAIPVASPVETLEHKWYGLQAMARAYAMEGNMSAALCVAREVKQDATRDKILVELADLFADDFQGALKCWSETTTDQSRTEAIWAIARQQLCCQRMNSTRLRNPGTRSRIGYFKLCVLTALPLLYSLIVTSVGLVWYWGWLGFPECLLLLLFVLTVFTGSLPWVHPRFLQFLANLLSLLSAFTREAALPAQVPATLPDLRPILPSVIADTSAFDACAAVLLAKQFHEKQQTLTIEQIPNPVFPLHAPVAAMSRGQVIPEGVVRRVTTWLLKRVSAASYWMTLFGFAIPLSFARNCWRKLRRQA